MFHAVHMLTTHVQEASPHPTAELPTALLDGLRRRTAHHITVRAARVPLTLLHAPATRADGLSTLLQEALLTTATLVPAGLTVHRHALQAPVVSEEAEAASVAEEAVDSEVAAVAAEADSVAAVAVEDADKRLWL